VAVRKAKTEPGPAAPGNGGKKPPIASKKTRGGTGKPSVSWAVLFWLAFAIFIFGLFIFNREAIGGGYEIFKMSF